MGLGPVALSATLMLLLRFLRHPYMSGMTLLSLNLQVYCLEQKTRHFPSSVACGKQSTANIPDSFLCQLVSCFCGKRSSEAPGQKFQDSRAVQTPSLFLPELGPVSREPGTIGMRKRKRVQGHGGGPLSCHCVASCKHLASVFSTMKWYSIACLAGSL